MNRRAYLASLGAGASALAGCAGVKSSAAGGPTQTPGDNEIRTLAAAGSEAGVVPVVPSGQPALLDFWATWCAPCEPQMAELAIVREQFPELHMLSITNEEDREAIQAFWEEHDATWPVAQDTELRTNQRFGVTRIPTLLVIDADGSITWRHVGLAAADTILAELEAVGA
ncbi:TlpA family protein disulfide reductase [Halosegnis sp.]|uniref:TlpA family protein disulfide reductase n=1 Tax=Halosegnis sp. TaxID=2864959 RepID=UPI0035D4AF6E